MNKKKKLLSLFNETYCRIRPCKHGVGVFAIRDIPSGTNPFKDCYAGEFIEITPEEVDSQLKGIREMIIDFSPLQEGKYLVPQCGLQAIDISFYLNHSDTPNMRADAEKLDFYTIREIKEGEELVVDYELYNDSKGF